MTRSIVEGFDLTFPSSFDWAYLDAEFEPLSYAFLLEHVKPGGVALDVGAHVGLMALRMARAVGPLGSVTAVEPAPDNLKILERNRSENPEGKRIRIVNAAAGSESARMSLHMTGSSDSHGLSAHPNTPTERLVEVDVVRLDDVVTAPLTFFKIDTEGWEIPTLQGMEGLLSSSSPIAGLVEWTPACQKSAGWDQHDLVQLTTDLGFTVHVIDDRRGRTMSLEEATAAALEPGWYGNLACVRTER